MRWTLDQKKHHVAAWRASGLTREQYCELYDIPFKSLRQWPQDVAKAEKRARAPEIIPVSVSGAPGAKWHLNRSRFGIRIDHDLASISDHSLASQSITIWHASDH